MLTSNATRIAIGGALVIAPGQTAFGQSCFHAGAPSLKDYLAAVGEITSRVNASLAALKQPAIAMSRAPLPARIAPAKPEKLVLAYGDELLQMARTRRDIVVLDGDLLSDCGIEAFKAELPESFQPRR